jgi:hypothetical protein
LEGHTEAVQGSLKDIARRYVLHLLHLSPVTTADMTVWLAGTL